MFDTLFVFDEISNGVVNSEVGELVRGPNSPLVHIVHLAAGDIWRAPMWLRYKNTWRLVRRKQRHELSIAHQRAKHRRLARFEGRANGSAGNFSTLREWTNVKYSKLPSPLTWPWPARSGFPWVGVIKRSKANHDFDQHRPRCVDSCQKCAA